RAGEGGRRGARRCGGGEGCGREEESRDDDDAEGSGRETRRGEKDRDGREEAQGSYAAAQGRDGGEKTGIGLSSQFSATRAATHIRTDRAQAAPSAAAAHPEAFRASDRPRPRRPVRRQRDYCRRPRRVVLPSLAGRTRSRRGPAVGCAGESGGGGL